MREKHKTPLCWRVRACMRNVRTVKWRTNREIAITPVFVFLLGRCRWSAEKPLLFPQDRKSTHTRCYTWSSRAGPTLVELHTALNSLAFSLATNIKFGPTLQFECAPPSCERIDFGALAEQIWMCQTPKVSVLLTADMQILSWGSAFTLSLLHERSSFCLVWLCLSLHVFTSVVEWLNFSTSNAISVQKIMKQGHASQFFALKINFILIKSVWYVKNLPVMQINLDGLKIS